MIPSPTELSILKLLWRDGTKSVGEIHAEIRDELNWSRSSTRKTIERMLTKKMLSSKAVHGVNVYAARIAKVPTLAGLIQNFAKNVLNLDGPLPVTNLARSEILSESELVELEAFLAAETDRQSKESE